MDTKKKLQKFFHLHVLGLWPKLNVYLTAFLTGWCRVVFSTVQTTVQYTPQQQQQQGVSSPYQNHARMLQQGYNSPHILQK
jgi:hypothetical protein